MDDAPRQTAFLLVALFTLLCLFLAQGAPATDPRESFQEAALDVLASQALPSFESLDPGDRGFVWVVGADAARRCNDYLYFVQRMHLHVGSTPTVLVTDDVPLLTEHLRRRNVRLPVVAGRRNGDGMRAALVSVRRTDQGTFASDEVRLLEPAAAEDRPAELLGTLRDLVGSSS